jgi:hypothetical protein
MSNLEDALPALADESMIRRLLAQCSQLADSGRLAEWSMLFTVDGELTVHGTVVRGREALRAHVEGQRARHHEVKHLVTNTVLDVDGPRATSVSDFAMVRRAHEGAPAEVALIGRFVDRLRRVEGAWQIASRTVEL